MKNWKKNLVGQTTNGGQTQEEYQYQELRRPLTIADSISRCVCTKCHNIFEINEETVLGLLNTMKILGDSPELILTKTTDFNKWYFETNYCNLCGAKMDVMVAIKKIV